MELLDQIVSWLVVGIGIFGWIVFVPQIRLLLKQKEARSISLGLIWGSFFMQAIICAHGIIEKDWSLVFAMATGLVCLSIILILIYYFRNWPGGRIK